MSHKSLTEAAAEVLNKSRADAVKMPMQDLETVRGAQPAAQGRVDLGGATHEDPQGNAIGKVTAAHRSEATPPGVAPADASDTKMKTLSGEGGSRASAAATSLQKAGEHTSPDENNGTGVSTAGHEYQHPVHGEEVELTAAELAEAKAEKVAKMKEKMKATSCKEDIDAILSGQSFSEEFRTQVTTIFEAAVIARAVMVVEELEADIIAAAEESVEEIAAEMEEQVDAYLTTMVNEWKAENAVAIESGLKAEIVEEFLTGLKTLFVEHYIDLPSEKVDVVESLTAEIAELTEKLNNSLNSNVELGKKINEAKKSEILVKVCEGLTATQAAKVKTLAEGVEFVTEDDYKKKLTVVRESYFNKVKQDNQTTTIPNQIAVNESEAPAQSEENSPLMEAYVNAISRTA